MSPHFSGNTPFGPCVEYSDDVWLPQKRHYSFAVSYAYKKRALHKERVSYDLNIYGERDREGGRERERDLLRGLISLGGTKGGATNRLA